MSGNTRNLRHGHVSFADGLTPDPNTLAVPIEDGNLSFDETTPVVVVKNRGALDHFSKGEEQPVTLSFTMKYTEFKSRDDFDVHRDGLDVPDGGAVSHVTVEDFLTGAQEDPMSPGDPLLTSTSGRTDVYSCTLVFTIDNPMLANDQAEVLTFTKFKKTNIKFNEGADADMISVSGTALLTTPASTRS